MTFSPRSQVAGLLLSAVVVAFPLAPARAQMPAHGGTPPDMVATYGSLADAILALKHTEHDLVRSILAAAHAHAQVELGRAHKAIAAGDTQAAQAALEGLAADVAQIATEGDNAVAAVRKRLLEGGHHHNAAGETQGLFDDGFVIVTRAGKQKLLAASHAVAALASAPKADALDAEWQKVEALYAELTVPAR